MRHLLKAALVAAVGVVGVVPAAASAGGEKRDVCHVDGKGEYRLLNISENAYDKHLAHGDAAILDDVPGMDGYVFYTDCTPVEPGEPKEGCFAAAGEGRWLITNGENPETFNRNNDQFGRVYDNPDCAEPYNRVIRRSAYIWAATDDEAFQTCEDLKPFPFWEAEIFPQTEPWLYVCVTSR